MVNECVQKWKGKSINFTQFLQICAVFLFSFFFKELVNTLVWHPASSYPDKCAWNLWWYNRWCNMDRFYFFYSLDPGKFEWNFRCVIVKQLLVIGGWGISYEVALIWMSLGFADNQSSLVQVMAWCHQATSITWANVDPYHCHHMVSLDQNESIGVIALVLHHNIIVFCNISWIWTEFENNIKYKQFWCTQNYFYIIYSHLDNIPW